jgi:putative peptidoglycan lipid II flippase
MGPSLPLGNATPDAAELVGAQELADDARDGSQATLARRGAAYGAGIFISRLLGLLREVLLARTLGTSEAASALVVSQTIPNLARTLVAEDVSQGVLVPVFSRTMDEHGAQALARLGLVMSVVTTVFMVLVGGLVLLLAGPLVGLIGPGIGPAARHHLVIPMFRIFTITLVFGGMGTVGSAHLILRHRYFGAAVAVAASNVPVIIVLLLDRTASVITIAVSLGSGLVIQALAQRLMGGRLTKKRAPLAAFRDRETWLIVRRIATLSLPVAISLGMANLSGVIDTAYCSLVSTGGPAAFDKAFRLILVPYGIVALAIGAAAVNTFIAVAKQPALFGSRLSEAVRLECALLIPAALITTVYAQPLITLIFARGHFNAASIHLTTNAMRGLGVVLPAIGLSALGTRAWTTREMPWVPASAGIVGLVGNLVLDAALYKPLGLAGIALSTAAVHFSVGGFLVIRAVPNKIGLTRSVAPIVAWSLLIGAVGCLPVAVAHASGSSGDTALELSMLAIGLVLASAVALSCPVPDYRVLLGGLTKRGSSRRISGL